MVADPTLRFILLALAALLIAAALWSLRKQIF
jgi:hypothetical protein